MEDKDKPAGHASDKTSGRDAVLLTDDHDVKLDGTATALITSQLKAMYAELVQQDIPEHLIRLLEDLKAKEDRK